MHTKDEAVKYIVVLLVICLGVLTAFGIANSGRSTRAGRSADPAVAALVRYMHANDSRIKVHGLEGTTLESYNWSGYADASNQINAFSKVAGEWTVPAVTCPTREDQLEANWVGLDGFSDQTVEQLGTISWCWQGTAHYYTWYEMYPSSLVTVGTFVQPGDTVYASVKTTKNGTHYVLRLTDYTTPGNSFAVALGCQVCLDMSAEWVIERPSFSLGLAPLADYGTTAFTEMSQTHTGGIGHYVIPMIDDTASYKLDTVTYSSGDLTATWINSF